MMLFFSPYWVTHSYVLPDFFQVCVFKKEVSSEAYNSFILTSAIIHVSI